MRLNFQEETLRPFVVRLDLRPGGKGMGEGREIDGLPGGE
jgi:hypothetical protein